MAGMLIVSRAGRNSRIDIYSSPSTQSWLRHSRLVSRVKGVRLFSRGPDTSADTSAMASSLESSKVDVMSSGILMLSDKDLTSGGQL